LADGCVLCSAIDRGCRLVEAYSTSSTKNNIVKHLLLCRYPLYIEQICVWFGLLAGCKINYKQNTDSKKAKAVSDR
jgi:hypothetical protein